jgi:hypothetical protein
MPISTGSVSVLCGAREFGCRRYVSINKEVIDKVR